METSARITVHKIPVEHLETQHLLTIGCHCHPEIITGENGPWKTFVEYAQWIVIHK